MAADDIITLRGLIPEHGIAMFTSAAPDGSLHGRPLHLLEIDDDGSLWFIVDSQADWVQGIRPRGDVNASFSDDDARTWVSVAGTAAIVIDAARLERLSRLTKAGTVDDLRGDEPVLLEVSPTSAQYWDPPSGVLSGLAFRAAKLAGRGSDGDRSGELHLG